MHDVLTLDTEILQGFSINWRREPPAKSGITQNSMLVIETHGELFLKLIFDQENENK